MVTADNRLLDQPSDPVRGYWNDSRTWDECLRIGQLMADEALRIIRDAPLQAEPDTLLHLVGREAAGGLRHPVGVVRQSPLEYPYHEDRTVTVRINLLNIGNLQVLTIPGEALPNIGCYLKRKMRGEHAMLFGLTNEALGYILTKVDFRSFPRYDYVSRTSLGEMTGEILLEHWLELVEQSPEPDRLESQASAVAMRDLTDRRGGEDESTSAGARGHATCSGRPRAGHVPAVGRPLFAEHACRAGRSVVYQRGLCRGAGDLAATVPFRRDSDQLAGHGSRVASRTCVASRLLPTAARRPLLQRRYGSMSLPMTTCIILRSRTSADQRSRKSTPRRSTTMIRTAQAD